MIPLKYSLNVVSTLPIILCEHILCVKMADALPEYDTKENESSPKVKIICLGDSAVGKSKYVRCSKRSLLCICVVNSNSF